MSDDYGPRWYVSSEEMGTGLILYAVIAVSIFSVLPAFFLGWNLGSRIWDVKIFKYPIAFLFACAYGLGLLTLYPLSSWGCIGVIALGWILLDYIASHNNRTQMWLIRTTKKCLRWLFSK